MDAVKGTTECGNWPRFNGIDPLPSSGISKMRGSPYGSCLVQTKGAASEDGEVKEENPTIAKDEGIHRFAYCGNRVEAVPNE